MNDDRDEMRDTVENNPSTVLLAGYMETYLPEQALGSLLDLDGAYMRALGRPP